MIRILVVFLLGFQVGCASLLGKLRKDLDDGPPESAHPGSQGGTWPEGGLLSDYEFNGPYSSVGHSERSPASSGYQPSAQRTWIDPKAAEQNASDRYRNLPSYAEVANLPPNIKRLYENETRKTREDFVDNDPNENSLWASNGQTNYYFTENLNRAQGDVLNLVIGESLFGSLSQEVKRTLNATEREMELELAQKKLRNEALAGVQGDKKKPKDGEEQDSEEKEPDLEVREANFGDIDVASRLGVKSGDKMTVQIVQRYPNGNYKIRGMKRVPYMGTTRMLSMVGIAKGSDIEGKDEIDSSKLYEYRVKVFR